MNEISQNPFDIMSLATGSGLFGRDDDLAWLMNGIQEKARLLLFGGEGMGKSSLLQQAGKQLAQQGAGWMIRLDLSFHRSTEDLAGVLGAATDQLKRSPDQAQPAGVLGDQGKRPSQGQKQDTKSPSNTGVSRPGDLLRKLDELNAFSLKQGRTIVVALDSFQQMARFGGEHFESTLMTAVESHSAMAYIVSGDEHGLNVPSSNSMHLLGGFKAQPLAQLDPKAFAQHIDSRFQSAGITSRGVGAACVDSAGSNTAQTVELAQRTFDLSIQARFANQATVQAALAQTVDAKKNLFAELWSKLSPGEQNVMREVAKAGGHGLLESNGYRTHGFKSDEQARSAIHSLVDKRLLDPAGPSGVKMQSAAMKQWTLQAHVNFGRQQKVGEAPTQQMSFSINFQRSSSPSKAPSNRP